MNHIPIDLYDGNLLQKRKKEDAFAFGVQLMSAFEPAMRYIR
jgi:hypothetical protein